ncbi:acyl carrier protein [Nostoc sp. PA-18-2419]|uniref:acyl carrier protein n=1 Tax=Nostoc sp. PA-18-2419 TaxID=2575443 RepID=UPI002950063D|nr:phosphopantetheine-binding protein [Nostoc sp. PA-18-2419]
MRQRVNLPTYPWQRQRYWVETVKVERNQTVARNDSLISHTVIPNNSDRPQSLRSYLLAEIAKTLQIPVAQLDIQQSLSSLGMDSLMCLELKDRIQAELKL